MSKFLKLAAMKNGGKVKVQKAVIGSLIGRGARKGVEMLTVSKSAIQKGAKDKLARDKFQEASKNYQRGQTKELEDLPMSGLKGSGDTPGLRKSFNRMVSILPPAAGETAKASSLLKSFVSKYPKRAFVGASAAGAGVGAVGVEIGRRMEKTNALDEKTFLGALRKIVKGE